MREFLAFLFFALFSLSAIGQEYREKLNPDLKDNPRLSLSGLSYPVGMNGEVFKSFKIDYQASERLQVQLQHFYEKYGTHESTRTSFIFKYYIKKNFYFFAGPEFEYGTNQVTGEYAPMRVNLNIGLGYEVNPNLLLELGYHTQINNTKTETFRNPAKPNTFSLRASF